jgi:class 3 adenylate cyclase
VNAVAVSGRRFSTHSGEAENLLGGIVVYSIGRENRRVISRPTGVVTFLLTDIEWSTRLWERRPDSMRSALARHDEIVRKAVAANGGTVFATAGDGFAAAFWSPADAVSAALMARLSEEPWRGDAGIRVRAALHVGVADERDGDYFGPVVK